jgi:hypothetical protein
MADGTDGGASTKGRAGTVTVSGGAQPDGEPARPGGAGAAGTATPPLPNPTVRRSELLGRPVLPVGDLVAGRVYGEVRHR